MARSSSMYSGRKTNALVAVPRRRRADRGREVARRIDGRVEQHRAAAGALGDDGRVEAAERAADHAPCARAASAATPPCTSSHRLARRGRQLRAPPDQIGPVRRRPRPRCGRALVDCGDGAEAVQVEQVRGRRRACRRPRAHAAARTSPASRVEQLLRGRRRSRRCSCTARGRPGRAAATTRVTSSSMRRGDDGARAHRRQRLRRVPARGRRCGRRRGRLPRAPTAAAPSSRRASWCSSAARRRRGCAPAPTLRRRPSMVVRIAVGWCAKSS